MPLPYAVPAPDDDVQLWKKKYSVPAPDDVPDQPVDEWASANDPAAMAEEQNQRLAARKPETKLQEIKRKIKDRNINSNAQTLKQRLGNMPLNPLLAAYDAARSLAPDSINENLPEAPVVTPAGVVGGWTKGAAGVGRRVWDTADKVSGGRFAEERKAAGDVVRGIDEELGNYDKSASGEMLGNALFSAPLGPGGKVMQAGGMGARAVKGGLSGAGFGFADAQSGVSDEDYATLVPLLLGGATGTAAAVGPELSAKLAPYLKDPERFLAEIRKKMGGTDTERVFKGQANAEKLARLKRSDAEFAKAYEGSEGVTPDLAGVKATINAQLEKLRTAVEPDKTLIARLEGIVDKISTATAPKAKLSRYEQLIADANGATSNEVPPDLSVKGLSDWRRLVGQRQQAAYDTAGNAVTVTPSREAGDAVRAIKGEIDKSIEAAAPETAKKLAGARSNWKTAMEPYIPDELGQNPLGRVLKTSTPDKELESLIASKSSNEVSNVLAGLNQKAKEAMKARILEDAFAAKSGAKLGEKQTTFAKSILGDNGKLTPLAEQLFAGDERKALIGAAKIAQYAHRIGQGTNVIGGMAAAGTTGGAAFAPAGAVAGTLGGLGGSLAGGWAARKWLPNFTAPMWEKAIRNPATRSLLVLLGKMPEGSPEFQRAAASLTTKLSMEE